MTTIDRAGLADEIEAETSVDSLGFRTIILDEAAYSRLLTTLRQPDQKGEAVGAQRWVPEDASDVMVAAALRVDWTNEDEAAVANNVWHAMVAASPQPAPEAGKLPSEVQAGQSGNAEHKGATDEVSLPPSDVPAGDDDHPRIWLEPKADSYGSEGRLWCQDDVWDDGVEYVRADIAEAQGRRIAELEEALRPFASVAENDIGTDETDADTFRPMSRHNRAPSLMVGDLRRASRATSGRALGWT